MRCIPVTMSPLSRHVTLQTDCTGKCNSVIHSSLCHKRTVPSSPQVAKLFGTPGFIEILEHTQMNKKITSLSFIKF